MLGRGVKRKWSCLEEELEDLPVVAGATEDKPDPIVSEIPPPFADGPVAAPSKSQQRQLVLGLCLEKLQRYQAGVELSLRRSVLLINTLRQIQEDMQSDGEDISDQDVHRESCLLRDSMKNNAVTCPNCVEEEIDSQSLPPESSNQEANSLFEQKTLPAATISAFSDAVNAMGYLSDLALDDIFEDIDTSMYETSDFPSAWWSNGTSLWANEDVKIRSHGHNGTIQSCLTDINELDHIMEILVKS